MAGGADKTKPTVFSMKGGAIHNSDVNSEILSLIKKWWNCIYGGWNSRTDGLGIYYTDKHYMNIDKV